MLLSEIELTKLQDNRQNIFKKLDTNRYMKSASTTFFNGKKQSRKQFLLGRDFTILHT